MNVSLAREALRSGLRLVRHAPLAILIWWLIRVVEGQVGEWLYGFSGGSAVDGALLTLAFETFLISAVFRALLRPERPGLAWFRLGWVEAKMAGLLAVTGLIGVFIAVVSTTAISYGLYFMRWPGLGSVVLSVGSVAVALALLRLAPLPAILVDTGRVDLRAALNATRRRYWILIIYALVLGLIERGLSAAWDLALHSLPGNPRVTPGVISVELTSKSPQEAFHFSWPSPYSLLEDAGSELLGIILLIFVSAAIVAVWRASKQTVD